MPVGTRRTPAADDVVITDSDANMSGGDGSGSLSAGTGSATIRIHDPAERARHMEWADVYYKSREQTKREQQYVREELKTLGYVEREVEVTDDEDDR